MERDRHPRPRSAVGQCLVELQMRYSFEFEELLGMDGPLNSPELERLRAIIDDKSIVASMDDDQRDAFFEKVGAAIRRINNLEHNDLWMSDGTVERIVESLIASAITDIESVSDNFTWAGTHEKVQAYLREWRVRKGMGGVEDLI